MSWLLDKIAGIFNGNAENATGSVGAENGFVLKNSTKVSELKQAFNERFGSLLPDNFWNNRLRFPIDITSSSNSFNDEQWKILESLGVVFLPKSLYKYYIKPWMFGSWQSIWTSNYQTLMDMTSGDAYVSREARIHPVRLIKDLK